MSGSEGSGRIWERCLVCGAGAGEEENGPCLDVEFHVARAVQ